MEAPIPDDTRFFSFLFSVLFPLLLIFLLYALIPTDDWNPKFDTYFRNNIPEQVTVLAETYEIGKEIGGGGSSIVCECTQAGQAKAGAVFAVKLLYGDVNRNTLKKEFEAVQKANHLHVIRARGIARFGNAVGIIMQPRADSDLRSYLEAKRKHLTIGPTEPYTRNDWEVQLHLTRRTLISWIRCLINTLHYLDSKNIRHGDIKPENILIHENRVILTDFGVSFFGSGPNERGPTRTKTKQLTTTTIATVKYLPPEAFLEGSTSEVDEMNKIGKPRDIFSLGCVLWEMLSLVFLGSSTDLPLPEDQENFADFWRKMTESIGPGRLDKLKSHMRNFICHFPNGMINMKSVWSIPEEARFRDAFTMAMTTPFWVTTDMIDMLPTRRETADIIYYKLQFAASHWWALHERGPAHGDSGEGYLICPCTSDVEGGLQFLRGNGGSIILI
ncbi:kinase-like protein [Fusarium austroafricanum]|uniref:Kinase-like protein n=1 Tax=Fusarium austroafricanum TaxID=2364996 RepID=A0A8H4KXF3_9HYPO|nr:kinase-like protein [Fusarium austroafricanum]